MPEGNIPVNLFCCYADEDEKFRKDLDTQLSPLKRNKPINIEYSRKISAGMERERERVRRMDSADIILLLISPDFMTDDYYDREIMPALERHKTDNVRVVPILLRHCDLTDAPFSHLDKLPTDGSPIMSKRNDRDKVLLDVVEGIRKVVNELVASHSFWRRKKGKV